MEFLFLGISITVLLFVLRRQYYNWRDALVQSDEISKLLFSGDWRNCAKRGDSMVMDRFDRLVEPPLDDIRRFSNAALVTGIGGTMGIFFIEAIIFLLVRDHPLPPSVITGMILSGSIALLSSLLGVIVHLCISLEILNKTQRMVVREEAELIELLKRSLEPIDDEIERFGVNQSPDVVDFINVVKKFLKRQDSLNALIEDAINDMNSSIGNAMREQQESVRTIERNIKELTGQFEMLPETIRKSFEVNEVFERVARSYIGELYEVFKEHREDLNETVLKNQEEVRDWLSKQIYAIMEEIVASLNETINKNIIDPLDRMREQLNATTREMPHATRDFASELRNSAEVLGTISHRLEKFPESIHEVVGSTVSETLGPISDKMETQMGNFNEAVTETHKKLSGTIEGLVNLIRKLVKELEIESRKR